MRTNTHRNSLFKNWKGKFNNNIVLILFGALFILGIVAGLVILKNMDVQTAAKLAAVFGNTQQDYQEMNFLQIYLLLLLPEVATLLVVFLSGVCALASPLVLLALL
jgi:nitric oxide reductase large subunit